MPHVADPEEATRLGAARGRHAEADAEGQSRLALAPGAQAVAVGGRDPKRRHRVAAVGAIGDVAREAAAVAPGLERRPDRPCEKPVSGHDGLEPLLAQDHAQRLAQAEEVVGGRGAAEILPELGRRDAGAPIPIGRAARGIGREREGTLAQPDEAEARGRHQPLLACRDHHIDAPVVHAEVVAAERGDAVDREQRRVAGRVDGRAHRRHVVAHRGRGIDMREQHDPDRAVAVGAQRGLDPGGIDRGPAAEVDPVDDDAQRLDRRGPPLAEAPGDERERPVARAEEIGVRRLPRRVAVADVDRDVLAGPCHRLQVGHERRHHLHEFARIDVRRRTMHRLKDPVGHDRGARDREIGPACSGMHGNLLTLGREPQG